MKFEQSWLERFRGGDLEAFDALYGCMGQRLYRFCYRLVGRREDAEDIVVQTFAAVHSGRSRFRLESSVETWLFAIAVNQARGLRRRSRETERLDEEIVDAEAGDVFERIELESLLGGLPPRQKLAFLLVKGEGLTYREAAEVMGKRMGTVQSDVFLATRTLRERLSVHGARTAGERCVSEL